MAGLTPRNSPESPFSGKSRPEIPRSPYRGAGKRGEAGAIGCPLNTPPICLLISDSVKGRRHG